MGSSTKRLEGLVEALIEGARKLVVYEGVSLPGRLEGVENRWLEGVQEVMSLPVEECRWVQEEIGRRLKGEPEVADWMWDWCDLEAETSTQGGRDVGILFAMPCVVELSNPQRRRELSDQTVWSLENMLKAVGCVSGEVKGVRLLGRLWQEGELVGLTWSQVRMLTDCLREQVLLGSDRVELLAWNREGTSELEAVKQGTDVEGVEGAGRVVCRYLVGVVIVDERDADHVFEGVDEEAGALEVLRGSELLLEAEGLKLRKLCSPMGFHEDLRRGQEAERLALGAGQVRGVLRDVEAGVKAGKRSSGGRGRRDGGDVVLRWRAEPGRVVGGERTLLVTVLGDGDVVYGALSWKWFSWEEVEDALAALREVLEGEGVGGVVIESEWRVVGSYWLQ